MTPEQTQRAISRLAAGVKRIERALDVAEAEGVFLKVAHAQGASAADITAARLILGQPKSRQYRRDQLK